MKCDRCGARVDAGEEREHHGRTICEDCYIDALASARACDPWAVYSARSFAGGEGAPAEMTARQSAIVRLLKETGGASPETLMDRLGIDADALEREIATLRHMEAVRGELRGGRKFFLPW